MSLMKSRIILLAAHPGMLCRKGCHLLRASIEFFWIAPLEVLEGHMELESKKRFQYITVLLIVPGHPARLHLFTSDIRRKPAEKKTPTYSSNMDDYVTPPKIHPYDLSGGERTGGENHLGAGRELRPLLFIFKATHTADLKHEKGLLPPLAKLQVKDVVLQKSSFRNPCRGAGCRGAEAGPCRLPDGAGPGHLCRHHWYQYR